MSEAVPIPIGGLKTNEDEADWLAATIMLRVNQTLVLDGFNANFTAPKLRDLLLLSLEAATRRARYAPPPTDTPMAE